MIKIYSKINDNLDIHEELFKNRSYLLEYYIEGLLQMNVRNQKWFYDEYINLIEFGLSLRNWLNEIKIKKIIILIYR